MIAERAQACADPPLFFDYNQKQNCEAFANLMNKVAAPTDNKLGAMEENALCVCHCLFGLVSCLKCFQDRSLAEAVKKRLKEEGE